MIRLPAQRLPVVVACACLLLVLAAPAARAHALLRGSEPAGGASLDRAPEKVTLTFTEPPDLSLSSVHVLDASGRAVERGKAQAVAGKPLVLEVPVGRVADGTYTVSWRVVSRADGHLTAGAFAFGVGVVAAPAVASGGGQAATSAEPPPSPLAVAGRWALDWGLILLVGAVASGLLVFRRAAVGLARSLLVAAVALAVAGLGTSIAAERAGAGVSLGELLGSGAGGKLVLEAGLLGVTAVVLAAVVRWPARREPLGLLGLGAAATMLAHVLAGHAASGHLAALNLLAQWVHLLAVGVWVGGFLWLLLGIRGATGGREGERVAAVGRFSRLATAALGLVVLTGLARALVEVGSWHGLVDTSFGRTLLVKGALVAGLVAIGAANRFRIVPALRAGGARLQTLGGTVRAELAVAIPILVAASLLSELPPAAFVSQAATSRRPPPAVVVNGSDFATTTRVRLTVAPGGAGPNRFVAKVVDYDSGQPVAARRVALGFSLPSRPDVGGSSLDLKPAGEGAWQGQGSQLSIDGRWSVTVLVGRPGGAVTVPLQLQTRSAEPSQQVRVARVPGQPTVYTITLAQGGSLQAYLDPGRPGRNVLHLTWFDPQGGELPIAAARAGATTPSGAAEQLSLQRWSAGHFVANLDLSAGRWSFAIDATSKAGSAASAKFEQVIEQ
ncbi:MAG TPA: copper resistance protein CopC [Actinomycetes bacterium]|jgi:copper transport protein|nr:copper resistance protein CopC [Actinomycetes bacterium]